MVEFKELEEGSAVDLFAKISGKPLPKVSWKFQDEDVKPSERCTFFCRKAFFCLFCY